jgi:hypothetical protein
MRPEEVKDTVMAMRNDAYLAMTGKDAPLLEGYDPHPGLVARGVVSDDHDPESCEADCCVKPIRLGERVHFDYSDILRRQSVTLAAKSSSRYGKVWRKTAWGKRGDVRHGVIVGIRTLSNGTITWFSDEPIVFHPELYFTAYLVAFDLRRKPVYLLPDDVTRRA